MDKRLLLAMTLSLLVLMLYSSLTQSRPPLPHKDVAVNAFEQLSFEPGAKQPAAGVVPAGAVEPSAAGNYDYNLLENNNLYVKESNGFVLKFSKRGGFLWRVFDKARGYELGVNNIGLVPQWAGYVFEVTEIPGGLTFSYKEGNGDDIQKTYTLQPNNIIELKVGVYNLTDSKIKSYNIAVSAVQQKDAHSETFALVNNVVMRKPFSGIKKPFVYDGRIGWAGLRDRYFCAAILPKFSITQSVIDSYNHDAVSIALVVPERDLAGTLVEDNYKIYIGPQDSKLLTGFVEGAQEIINFGTFDPISKAILFLLSLGFAVTKNWGWAIILVSILIYVLLFPLSLKSMLSMRKMQTIQPKIEELKIKCKGNPQKLNTETMELYKREKINPFGGCLPMLLQIPVFFAFYQLLLRFIGLRGAHFLWIKDLSEPDRLFVLKTPLPLVGTDLNILPLLMAGGMFLQQKLSGPKDGASSGIQEQQKMMSMIMPVLFGVLFYKMPSGLVLYWFMNNMLMLVFQWKIAKTGR